MSTNECSSESSTKIADRPTRAAVVLALAMGVAPLLPLLVSAAGCSWSTPHATAVEERAPGETTRLRIDAPAQAASTERPAP